MPWTRFMDMHSGGGMKEPPYEYIYIEAPEDEARVIFYNRFGHNPDRVTCTCCGSDYSIDESSSLQKATAFERNCEWENGGYVERQTADKITIRKTYRTPADDPWGLYQTVEQYIARRDVLIIKADEIKPQERVGAIPQQGYVWMGGP